MVLLSFDVEEFDYPEELNISISEERKIKISSEGLARILDVLEKNNVRATFFCTAFFAERAKDLINRIVSQGHEIASHGYNHSSFKEEDLLNSRVNLEELSGKTVLGYRMARMQYVDARSIQDAGYKYDSSLNPLFVPGRYNNFNKPRTIHRVPTGLIEIPASVSPVLRLPLFWLSLHHFPFWLYKCLAQRVLKTDGYLITYFHPWEFADIKNLKEGELPYIATHNSGEKELKRLNNLIIYLKNSGYEFGTISEFLSIRQYV